MSARGCLPGVSSQGCVCPRGCLPGGGRHNPRTRSRHAPLPRTRGRHSLGPEADTPLWDQRQTPRPPPPPGPEPGTPQSDTTQYGLQAAGTHPTGMHSCYSVWKNQRPMMFYFYSRKTMVVCKKFEVKMYTLKYSREILYSQN